MNGTFKVLCWNNGRLRWARSFSNLWTTEGKNADLDDVFGGTAIANLYMGLISSTGFSAIAAGDTAAGINGANGWLEAAAANGPTYSQGTRPGVTLAAASGGSRATTSPAAFSITSNGTVKGCFTATASLKDGTGGKVITAGLFTGGDQTVSIGDRLLVTWTGAL
jgi:hypothetical protein